MNLKKACWVKEARSLLHKEAQYNRKLTGGCLGTGGGERELTAKEHEGTPAVMTAGYTTTDTRQHSPNCALKAGESYCI